LKNGTGIEALTNKLIDPHPHKLHDEDEPRHHKRTYEWRYKRFNDEAMKNTQAVNFGKNKSGQGYKPMN
jgi:hypothetical protein